jgi:hypothetical protein
LEGCKQLSFTNEKDFTPILPDEIQKEIKGTLW